MGAVIRILVAAVLIAITAQAQYPVVWQLPLNPHEFMNARSECLKCHATYLNELDPHVFHVDVVNSCYVNVPDEKICHRAEDIGRSHPVNVEPRRSRRNVTVPPELPLHDNLLTCGTCHNPHADWLSMTKLTRVQEPKVALAEVRNGETVYTYYYLTCYLRVTDPAKGFDPLCNSCHEAY